jgi:hypothetical protein
MAKDSAVWWVRALDFRTIANPLSIRPFAIRSRKPTIGNEFPLSRERNLSGILIINVLKLLQHRLWYLSILVVVAAWQAYTAFDRFFTLTTKEMGNLSNEVWFFVGPISLFLVSSLG